MPHLAPVPYKKRMRWFLAAGALVFVTTPAFADPVTLAQAITLGAQHAPVVVESTRNESASAAFANDPGGMLPSVPQVTVMAGARNPVNLPTGPEIVVTAQQEISPRHLGSARKKAADWASRAATSEVERTRIEGASSAALAWVDLMEAQDLGALRVAAATDAAKLVRIADARVNSGVATAVERSLAQAEEGSAKLAILDAEGRSTEARFVLAEAIGRSLDSDLVAAGALDGTDERAFATNGDVSMHPAVRAADARAAQLGAEGSVLHATMGPTFFVGASVWREGSGDKAAAAVVTVPLPFFDPARHDVARQNVLATQASSHAARLRVELAHDLRRELHEREHTREVRVAVRDGVVAPLRHALATAMTAYAAGTSDLGVVLLARRSALAAEERLIAAEADVWRADLHTSALTGTLLPRPRS